MMLNRDKTCSIEGCVSPVCCVGVCGLHYGQLKAKRREKPCACGCENQTGYGYVKGHRPRSTIAPAKRNESPSGTLAGFSREELAEVFEYSIVSGRFYRKVPRGRWVAGERVGSVDSKGYLHVSFGGRFIRLHRLAVFMLTGELPVQIDHHTRNKQNNAWHNLRPCNAKSNAGNSGLPSHNTSGLRGVYLNNVSGKWAAQIKIDGKVTYLGRRDTREEAARLYDAAARQHFGEFAHVNGV